jgi:hypothetical protein
VEKGYGLEVFNGNKTCSVKIEALQRQLSKLNVLLR